MTSKKYIELMMKFREVVYVGMLAVGILTVLSSFAYPPDWLPHPPEFPDSQNILPPHLDPVPRDIAQS